MKNEDIQKAIMKALGDIAPDADLGSLRPDRDMREELDIDSMDFLNFVVALKEALGVEVPEADYEKILTVNNCIVYLAKRAG
ncbi:MAG: acyl carrier protein [Deltaproteobacteria bacterium]|nr:acyl carrier protein [Deltaproteobacteria bacterium]